MSFTIIKPGTKIEFMNRRFIFFGISGAIILAGLIALIFMGLNLGVDFSGGTKLVVAFSGEHIERDVIRQVVVDKFKEMHPEEDAPQVEVQDFDSGGEETDQVRYMIFTEVVTLLTDNQKASIVAAIKKQFGEGTNVSPPQEGGDQFFITFEFEAPIVDRLAELNKLFAAQGLERVVVESDKVRDLNLENYKEINLESVEERAKKSAQGMDPMKINAELEAKAQFAARVNAFKEANKDLSFTVKIEELNAKMEEAIRAVPELGERFVAVESSTSISASVGSDLLNSGLLAVVYACIGILLYIALRFDFKYGPGAVVALLHDAFITVGIFAITQIPFSLPIIAAVLTIIGYSVNDTIVVFDRIRENVIKMKGMPFDRIINTSINETLSRTVLTSLTTLAVVVSIFILGGGLIQDFAFALIIGVLIGTYSSIFVASPILLALHRMGKKETA
jgi:preprotein translocase subunit SecF